MEPIETIKDNLRNTLPLGIDLILLPAKKLARRLKAKAAKKQV